MNRCLICHGPIVRRGRAHGHGACDATSIKGLPRCRCGALATQVDSKQRPVCAGCAPVRDSALLILRKEAANG